MNTTQILLGIIVLLLLGGVVDIISRLRIIIALLEDINSQLDK